MYQHTPGGLDCEGASCPLCVASDRLMTADDTGTEADRLIAEGNLPMTALAHVLAAFGQEDRLRGLWEGE